MDATTALVAAAIILIWGVQGFLIKIGLAKISIPEALLVTVVVSTALNLALLALLYVRGTQLALGAGGFYIGLSMFIGFVSFVLWYFVVERAKISVVSALTSVYPAVTIVLGILVLNEKLSPTSAAGVVLALLAAILLAL